MDSAIGPEDSYRDGEVESVRPLIVNLNNASFCTTCTDKPAQIFKAYNDLPAG